MKKLLVVLIHYFFIQHVNSDIIGEPKIRCAPTGITIMLETDSPFKGALFLRGSADKKSCKANFSAQPSQNISFEFGFDDCPSRRKRQIVAPRGMTMSSVLVVSYHGSIITHRDVAYQIDCFYREENSRVETMLSVNAPQPRILSDEPKLPTCDYRVEVTGGKAVAGGIVTSSLSETASQIANVGDSVIHIWTCSGDAPSDVYCIQVYSCTAEDGGSDTVQVVDENGCTTDGELLSPIKYKEGSMRAAASSHAFKFVDNHIVYFKCNIRITVKNPSGECPVNNCSPNGSTGLISRKARDVFEHPFLLLKQKVLPVFNKEINILVTSGELIIEEEQAKNHILSSYRPDKYSYRKPEKMEHHWTKSCSFGSYSGILLFIIVLFNF
ncbi:ZP domain-containing protein [Caenorhabditis elegans]|uniref:ZP domain-containing protein n=1 Tax=Caenorhabditis elegans TaxID=6239 RepID=O18213_CAEEL|nr:ZP domain-containing protein [Caenorhabditis elegans]CAB16488.1 ZP domain-containing protein [Caenorhabditis elegans]|eukprot:NP_496097.1 CUTiclin-Like [Caenorhabditis elegans]